MYPLYCEKIVGLVEPFALFKEYVAEGALFVAALGTLSEVYTVWDLVEESCLCKVFPVREVWSVDHWEAGSSGEVLMPDFAKSFGLSALDIDTDQAEAAADVLLGREAGKGFNSAKAIFCLKRRNCVFEFFKISAPLRAATRAWEAAGNPRPVGGHGCAGPKRQKTERLILSPRRARRSAIAKSEDSGHSSGVQWRWPWLLFLSKLQPLRRWLGLGRPFIVTQRILRMTWM